MLSNFCVVFTITWNVSVGLGLARPGAAAVEPQDASAAASMNTRAAVSADVPRSRLLRPSPQALCFDLAGGREATARYPAFSGPPGLKDRPGLSALSHVDHIGLQIGKAGDPWAWRVSIGSWNASWQRLSTSWICQSTHALAISGHSTSIYSISSEMSSRASPNRALTHGSADDYACRRGHEGGSHGTWLARRAIRQKRDWRALPPDAHRCRPTRLSP